MSDVLPYEVPITFSNRHFYDFLQEMHVEVSEGTLRWLDVDDATSAIVRLLFSLPDNPNLETRVSIDVAGRPTAFVEHNIQKAIAPIPFAFKIAHKEGEFRDLAIPHPRSQVAVVEFYDRTKETIIYLCSRSPFSIRRPASIARCIYHKDRTHYEDLARDETVIEQEDREYENLRSFFVYKDFSNVYKFYESHRYHRCEKKYGRLAKLDVSKCFDSIYTHSLAWALLGKEAVKQNLHKSRTTFAGHFDILMQRLNYNETNGIIIGPEFSRIFAELIFQSVDVELEVALLRSDRKLKHKVDYEIYRYVDDFFVFYNSDADLELIAGELQHALRQYGLYLNTAKTITYERPIITEISRAKREIARLFEEKLRYNLEKVHDEEESEDVHRLKGTIYVDSRQLIIEFKTVLAVCGVQYRDILNYALAIVERKTDEIIRRFARADPDLRSIRQLTYALRAILEFAFFIYSVSPRVNSTIKLCRILRVVCEFFRPKAIPLELRHAVFKSAFDDIRLILRKNKAATHTQVETLYLLIVLTEFGREYLLEEEVLAEQFGIMHEDGAYKGTVPLNYFLITVLLFYMGGRNRYSQLHQYVEELILNRFKEHSVILDKDTQMTLLLMDVLACPYVSDSTKVQILAERGISDSSVRQEVVDAHSKRRCQWFTTWRDFDFGMELDRKKGFEVY